MTYLLQPKPSRRTAGKRAIRAIASILLAVFLLSFVAPSVLPKVFGVIISPLWSARTQFTQAISRLQIFKTRASVIEENVRLKEENEVLRIDMLAKQSLINENNELKNILGRNALPVGVAAAVILHPSQTHYDIYITDKPAGISTGLAVKGRVALGRVAEDLGTSLKIVLYSSPGVRTEGRLMKDGTVIPLEGKGSGNFTAVVPRDFPVAVDDLIVLPGDGSFVVAHVKSIDETETDSFKLVRASVPLNIFNVRWVEIIPYE